MEKCPLDQGSRTENIASICLRQCVGALEQATPRPYDLYEGHEHCNSALETAAEILVNDGGKARRYSVVDQCISHGYDVGEETYVFECNNN